MAGSRVLYIQIPPATAALTDFPFLLTGARFPQVYWDNIAAEDLVMKSMDGVELKHELVSIDTVNKTQELYVKVDRPAGKTIQIALEYDDPVGAETNDTDTWTASYLRVWHMNDGVDTSHIHESTAAADHGVKMGAATPPESAGAFDGDKSQHFTASDYISHTCERANNEDVFIEIIMKLDCDDNGQEPWLCAGTCLLIRRYNYNRAGIRCDNAGIMAGDWQIIGNGDRDWHYLWGSYEQDGVNCYLDDGVDTVSGTPNYYTKLGADKYYGSWFGGYDWLGSKTLHGYIAEARILSAKPPEAWRLATFNNLINNASTYTVLDKNWTTRSQSNAARLAALGLI